jgi:flagellar protein FlaG
MAIQFSVTLPAGGAQSVTTGQRPAANPQGAPAVTPAGGETAHAQEATPPPQQQAQQPVDKARVSEAVETINRKLQEGSQQLRFAVDHDSGKMVVRVVDTATDQVIRQIPSEVAIAISQSLEKLQGLLVRQQA